LICHAFSLSGIQIQRGIFCCQTAIEAATRNGNRSGNRSGKMQAKEKIFLRGPMFWTHALKRYTGPRSGDGTRGAVAPALLAFPGQTYSYERYLILIAVKPLAVTKSDFYTILWIQICLGGRSARTQRKKRLFGKRPDIFRRF